jgi:membrane-bound lytic murein transglycosylase D
MPDTARRYGLTVNSTTDDRLDIQKSTLAAARYLRDLRSQFGSWSIVLAAYNAGEKLVQKAVMRAGSQDFALLQGKGLLPAETIIYVPAVLAASALLNGEGLFETIPTQDLGTSSRVNEAPTMAH